MSVLGMVKGASDRIGWLRGHPAYEGPRTLMRAAVWSVRAGLGRPAQVPFAGGELYCPPEQRGMSRLAYIFGDRYEAELAVLPQLVRPGMVVYDIGANYGAYTLALANLVGTAGRVIAFEPTPASADVLRKTLDINQLTQVEVREIALADRAGQAALTVHADSSRNRLSTSGDSRSQLVEVARLGDLDLPPPDFMKIDVEGAEMDVFRGAQRVIGQHRPSILYEQSHTTAEQAWAFLTDFNYTMHQVQSATLVPLAVPPVGVANLVALPA